VAITLDAFRAGVVDFIGWLDAVSWLPSHNQHARITAEKMPIDTGQLRDPSKSRPYVISLVGGNSLFLQQIKVLSSLAIDKLSERKTFR